MPLAPSKLTFFPDLEHGRQCGAKPTFDRIGREAVRRSSPMPAQSLDRCINERREPFRQDPEPGSTNGADRVNALSSN